MSSKNYYSDCTDSKTNSSNESTSEIKNNNYSYGDIKEFTPLSERGIQFKRIKLKIFFFFFIGVTIFVVILNILIIVVVSRLKQRIMFKSFVYKMVYYGLNNETIEGEIKKNKKVRGFSISDDNGSGYIYPISFDDEKDVEYKIEGMCYCCVNCLDDSHCKNNEYCVDKLCVECEKDNNCNNNLICVRGKCVNGYCHENDECSENELCNIDGRCVEGCKYDYECGIKEICNRDGTCIIGCRSDIDCSNGMKCLEGKCSESCRNNFDCENFDSVCVNSQCININENSETCLKSDECSDGYFCDYEYMICVKQRKETKIHRSFKVLPIVCTSYGIVTLFIMIASYSIVSQIADYKLNVECKKMCAGKHSSSKGDVTNIDISERRFIKLGRPRQDSECNGRCRPNDRLKNEEIIIYADNFCYKQTYSGVVTIEAKEKYLRDHSIKSSVGRDIFSSVMSLHCKQFTHSYWYHNPKNIKHRLWRSLRICAADRESVQCESLKYPNI